MNFFSPINPFKSNNSLNFFEQFEYLIEVELSSKFSTFEIYWLEVFMVLILYFLCLRLLLDATSDEFPLGTLQKNDFNL